MAESSKLDPVAGKKSPPTLPLLPPLPPPPPPTVNTDSAAQAPSSAARRDLKPPASARAYQTTVALPGQSSPAQPAPTRVQNPPAPGQAPGTQTLVANAEAPKPPETHQASDTPTSIESGSAPSCQNSFGNASYVKDGSNAKLLDLAKQAAAKAPELTGGSFAAAAQSGKLGADDVKKLQTLLEQKGYSVGDTGVDGKFGPRTYQALQQMLSGAPPQIAPGQPSAVDPHHAANPGQSQDSQAGKNQAGDSTDVNAGATSSDPNLAAKLRGQERNRFDGVKHECFHYAWAMVQGANGKGMDKAPSTTEGRGQGLSHLNQMVADGKVKTGDVIYVNKRPGSDDGSHNLSNGPHWFVYMGNGKFADQYGPPKVAAKERSAAEMQAFVPNRVIDRIFHPF